jgi:hypothetical protein
MENILTDENGKPLTYWGGLADEAFEKESAINKLAEEVYGKNVVPDYEEGFVDGYNKAKETLYTEEQMELCWIAAMSNRTGFSDSVSYTEFIKSLKQK